MPPVCEFIIFKKCRNAETTKNQTAMIIYGDYGQPPKTTKNTCILGSYEARWVPLKMTVPVNPGFLL